MDRDIAGKGTANNDNRQLEEFIYERTRKLQEANQRVGNCSLEGIADAFFDLDYEYRFTYLSRDIEDVWDCKIEDILGRDIREACPQSIGAPMHHYFHSVIQTGEPAHFTTKSALFDRWREVDVYPSSNGISVYFRDITNRKRIEDQMRESRGPYHTLFKNTEDGFVLLEPIFDKAGHSDDYRMLKVNAAWERLTGLKAADFVGRQISEAMPAVESDWSAILAEVARTGTSRHFEIYNANSGLWYDLHAFLCSQSQVGVLFRDITEHKQTQHALQESERRYREIVKYAPAGIYEIDFRNQRFLSVNDAMCEVTGYSREELLSMNPMALMDEPGREVFRDRMRQWLGGEKPASYVDYLIKTKDGREIWAELHNSFTVDESGRPLGATVIAPDVTERKKAEEALRESEERFRVAQEHSPDGFTILRPVRDAQGQIVDFTWIYENAAIAKLNGTDPEAVIGQRLLELFPSSRGTSIFESYIHAAETGESCIFEAESSLFRPTWFRIAVVRMNEDIAVLAQDITERKLAEEAAQKEKMMTLGINRILRDALFCDSEEELGMTCLKVALELTGSSMGFISEINREGLLDDIAISEMGWEACHMPNSNSRILQSGLNIRGIRGRVILEGKPLLTNNPNSHPDRIGLPVGHPSLDSFLGTPLMQNGQVIGMIALGNKKGGFSGQDIIIAEALSPAIVEVLMRKRAEAALRESEEQQAFLLKLSDAIRPLGEPIAVLETASRMTGEYLGAARVVYIEINQNPEIVVVERDWARTGVPSAVGSYRINDFGTFVSGLLRDGLPVIVEDAANDPRISPAELINWELVNTRALISCPLIKDGLLVAYLGVYHDQSHHWTDGEVKLIIEIAERAWASVERAKAQEEVIKSRDFLEEKVAERTKELTLERQRLFDVLDTIPNSIILLSPDYHFRFSNRAHRQKHGLPDGRCCYEFIFGLDNPCENCQSFIPLTTGQPYHYEYTDRDGNIIAVHDYPFTDIDGTTLILEINDDITEQRRLEREMARLDRLNLIGEMAAGIGHEIRNPMTSVRGFLQMLNTSPKYQGEAEFFELMIEELDRANSIITEYLGMAKDKRVDLQPRSLDHLVTALHPMIMSDANLRGINLHLDLNDPPEPLIDVNEIRQLVMNMVRNGMDAMGEQGTLTIGTLPQGDEVVLYIKDQGHGIPPENFDKLEVPFFSTKDNGTGLGLPVCYSIAARHHARIDYETSPAGTTFYVRFPIESGQSSSGLENNGTGGGNALNRNSSPYLGSTNIRLTRG